MNAALDTEALRVINSSPKWEPGTAKDGTPIATNLRIPIVFQVRSVPKN